MSALNTDIDEINQSFDELLLDSDAEATSSMEGDDMAPAVVPDSDSDELDSEVSDDDEEEAENTWEDEAQKYDRWTFSEPVGLSAEVENCETPLQFYELFFSEELLAMIVTQTNVYGQAKQRDWTHTDPDELRIFFGL
ncbi:hypothetical protein COOONC_22451, partial [Cooperia oncophora]